MKPHSKNLLLALTVALIIGVIGYIQSHKPVHLSPSQAPDVFSTPLTTTPSSGSATASPSSSQSSSPQQRVDRTAVLSQKAAQYSKAKELLSPSGFVNTDPFTLSQYVGKKVILVDFWTYSCINCQRTIPYLNAWYQKYKNDGLLIVGVHTPEFDFEKNIDNVTAGVKKLGIQYPVVLDNDHGTWDAYQNQYWPHEYLIDIDGYVVHDHIGEGDYAATEHAIQQVLQERSAVLGLGETIPTTITTPADVIAMDVTKVQSPETYVGYQRDQLLANGTAAPGTYTFSLPPTFAPNRLYLDGTWTFDAQYATNTSTTAKLVFPYNAKNVYLVASSDHPVVVKVFRDGMPVRSASGEDVHADGTVTISSNRLYNLVQGGDYGAHTLELDIEGAGLRVYTLTFG